MISKIVVLQIATSIKNKLTYVSLI